MKIPVTGNWCTDKPQYYGEFVVIESRAIMVDSKTGSHSYCYDIGTAIYDGDWDHNIYAWLDVRFPELPKDSDGNYIPIE